MTLNDTAKGEVLDMYRQGMAVVDIYRQTGIGITTIYRILQESGMWRNKGKTLLDPETQVNILDAWVNTDERPVEMARRLGVKPHLVYNTIKASGIQRDGDKDPRLTRLAMIDEAVKSYLAGKTLWEINRDYGVTSTTLYNELHKRGLNVRSHEGNR